MKVSPPLKSTTKSGPAAACRSQLFHYLGVIKKSGDPYVACARAPCSYTHRDYTKLTEAAVEKALTTCVLSPSDVPSMLALYRALPLIAGARGVHTP